MRSLKVCVVMCILLFGCNSKHVSKETKVYGFVRSDDNNFKPFSYSGVMHSQFGKDGGEISSAASVDSVGFFEEYFPRNTKVVLNTFYENYFDRDTTINTAGLDSIRIDFTVFPKHYIYTEKKANDDVSQGRVQLITYDTVLFDWNKKINYTSRFGFTYILLKKPDDYEFENNMDRYNLAVRQHLDTLADSTWYQKIYVIEDSLIFLEADNFGKAHQYNLAELHFSRKTRLSKKMINKLNEKKAVRMRFDEKKEPPSFTMNQVLNGLEKEKELEFIVKAEDWSVDHYDEIIPDLIRKITNDKEVGLVNTADLIIPERIESGDLQSYGHGWFVMDDLFKISGRADFILKSITGEDFGFVSMHSSRRDLKRLQNRWVFWLQKTTGVNVVAK